jgi:hypothetical protein
MNPHGGAAVVVVVLRIHLWFHTVSRANGSDEPVLQCNCIKLLMVSLSHRN